MFAVNHLAHFLLFQELRDLLLAGSQPERDSRVVNVSSGAHRRCTVHLDDLNFEARGYDPVRTGHAALQRSATPLCAVGAACAVAKRRSLLQCTRCGTVRCACSLQSVHACTQAVRRFLCLSDNVLCALSKAGHPAKCCCEPAPALRRIQADACSHCAAARVRPEQDRQHLDGQRD